MTIRSTELDQLLQDYYLAAPGSERVVPYDKLVHFIDAHVVVQRRKAVDQFKEMCRISGLTAVRAEGFQQLLNDLDRFPDGDIADHARNLRHDALNAADSLEDTDPEFTIRADEDLNRLLGSTASLLSGFANHDVVMAWSNDLQVILHRLAQSVPKQTEDHNSQDPNCSCPSGNGSLRWPCLVHPPALDEDAPKS